MIPSNGWTLMKLCCMCKTVKSLEGFNRNRSRVDGMQRQCRDCQGHTERKYSRSASGSEQRKITERTKYQRRKITSADKLTARSRLRQSLRSGKLQRGPCFRCGSLKTEGHHADYSKPLDVIWVCRVHHADIHRLPAPAMVSL